jgi:viologen exporter family transport system permease protein
MTGLGLYLRYAAVSLRAQLQYRASAIMQAVGSLAITAIEFVGIWALFHRFGSLRGWTLPEVALLYGMIEVTFAVSHMLTRGLDTFPSLVSSGNFDRLLVRPRSAVLQLLGRELAVRRLGRVVQGVAVLIWAGSAVSITWSPAKALLLLAAMAGGVCLFVGLAVVQATIAFWTVEPLEIMNAFTDGGAYTAQYPMTIYRRWFRTFLTFVVPLACANYLPGLAILGKADPLGAPVPVQWLSPLAGLVFLLVALRLWRAGVRRYMSAGG